MANDIKSNNQSSSMGRNLITKIRVLLHQDIDVMIQYIYWETNMCVDALAKDGRFQLTFMCIFAECSSFLNQILANDFHGNSIPRLILL